MRRDEATRTMDGIRDLAKTRRPDLLEIRQAQVRNQADLRLQIAQGKIDYTAGAEYRRQQGPSGTGNSLGIFFSAPLPVFNRNQGEIVRAQREMDQAAAQIRALEAKVDNEVRAHGSNIPPRANCFRRRRRHAVPGKERAPDDRIFVSPR